MKFNTLQALAGLAQAFGGRVGIDDLLKSLLTQLTPAAARPMCRAAFRDEFKRGEQAVLLSHAQALVTAIEAADFEDAGDALANVLGECAID